MLATYGAAMSFVLASVVTGQGVAALLGRCAWWAPGPAVGMSLLLAVCALGVRLPGTSRIAAVLCAVVVVAALVLWVRRRAGAPPILAILIALAALLVAALPFYVNGRFGLLGVSLNNDTSVHLLWAEALRSRSMASLYPLPAGYPLGPHALMATLAATTGIAMDDCMNGLLVAVPALTALAALPLLAPLPPLVRAAGGLLVGWTYLLAAYFGQGAFKETLLALFLVAFTAVLAEVQDVPSRGARVRLGITAGILAAGGIHVYSYLGIVWFVAIAGLWLALLLVSGGRRNIVARARAALPAAAGAVLVAGTVLVLAIAPQLDRMLSYFRALSLSPAGGAGGIPESDLGNLAAPLSPYEGLGLWPNPDYRFPPANVFHAGELGLLALVVVVLGAITCLRRREVALVAAAGATAIIFALADHGQSPYVAAKALMLASPLVLALGLRAYPLPAEGAPRWAEPDILRLVLMAAFALFAASSTTLALRGSPVASDAQERELAGIRSVVGRKPTLFLGSDDHYGWWLRGVRLGAPLTASYPPPIRVDLRPQKPSTYGAPLDFDSVASATLDRFTYVVIPRTDYDSSTPPNFVRVRAGRLYELWRRRGPTRPRATLAESGQPGATLKCRSSVGRRLANRGGTAEVRDTPVVSREAFGVLPGTARDVALPLKPGRWRLALQYTSTTPLRVVTEHREWRLPANTARPGPFFELGEYDTTARGAAGFRVIAERPARLASRGAGANISALAATRIGSERSVPLAQACGRYVDWYTVARSSR